jgi:hypothetical protein
MTVASCMSAASTGGHGWCDLPRALLCGVHHSAQNASVLASAAWVLRRTALRPAAGCCIRHDRLRRGAHHSTQARTRQGGAGACVSAREKVPKKCAADDAESTRPRAAFAGRAETRCGGLRAIVCSRLQKAICTKALCTGGQPAQGASGRPDARLRFARVTVRGENGGGEPRAVPGQEAHTRKPVSSSAAASDRPAPVSSEARSRCVAASRTFTPARFAGRTG